MCFTELIEEVLGAEHGLSVHAALIEVDRRMARSPNGETVWNMATGPQGSLGNLREIHILTYVLGYLRYFQDFGTNIKVFIQNNVISELLQQK